MILLVSSIEDPASQNIAKQALLKAEFEKTKESFQGNPQYRAKLGSNEVLLITINDRLVEAQNVTESFTNVELVVFISRHSSESGMPTLSVHTPGNLNKAELGGTPRSVSISPANAMRHALLAMKRIKQEMKLDYEVSYEGTHHGPSLDVPCMFTELGSSPAQWNDTKAAQTVARSTIEAISLFPQQSARAVVGIGGTHYNAKFTKIALQEDIAFSHMIPKYAIAELDAEMLKQCIHRTLEPVEGVILDWKGIKGENKPTLTEMLDETGLPVEKH